MPTPPAASQLLGERPDVHSNGRGIAYLRSSVTRTGSILALFPTKGSELRVQFRASMRAGDGNRTRVASLED